MKHIIKDIDGRNGMNILAVGDVVTITPDAAAALKSYFEEAVANKDANFGNARFVRNVFERTLQRQANRLSTEVNLTSAKLAEITKEDLPEEF